MGELFRPAAACWPLTGKIRRFICRITNISTYIHRPDVTGACPKPPRFEKAAALSLKKTNTSPNPFLVLVVPDADHLAFAETGEVDGKGRAWVAVLPQVHHSDLCFGGDIRSRDQIGIDDLALQYPVLRVFYIFEVGGFDIDDHSLSRKGEQRFQYIVFQVGGRLFDLVEEESGGNKGMVQEGRVNLLMR